MMGLALVESYLGPALHIDVKQPVDYEQGALDAADLPQGKSQFVLTAGGAPSRPREQGVSEAMVDVYST